METLTTIPEMGVGWKIGYHPKRCPSHVEDDIVCALWKHKGNTFLNTKGCAMIQVCMEMLVEYGHMDWQGSLRATYDKYVHPEVVNMNDKRLFDNLNEGKLLKAFQYETPMGAKAISTIHPTSLAEVAVANSLMRLMSEDGEQPMDKYARYKTNPEAWDEDMVDFGLTDEERQTMHDILDIEGGVCSSQELMMKMSMDSRVSGFDTILANKLRKVVAKKKVKEIGEVKELLYNCGRALGTSETMLDYVWDVQIATQLGYSFSVLHTIGYSTILMQELHLITNYPPIYWACAVLQIESGAIEMEQDDDDDDDETEAKEKNTNYDVIGGAIAMLQRQGVVVDYPDINEAKIGFAPNEKDNTIIYGFKSLSGINNKVSDIIMNNRPYVSMKDFYERLCLTKHEVTLKTGKTQMKALVGNKQMISLIKSGAFDKLEGKPRKEIMRDYIRWITPRKENLNVKHIEDLDCRGVLDERFDECLTYYNFRMYLLGGQKKDDKTTKSIKWYLLDGEDAEDTAYCVNRFFDLFPELIEGKHWKWADDVEDAYGEPIWVATGGSAKGSFEYIYKQRVAPLTSFMKSDECLDAYNDILFKDVFYEYEKGTNAKWEMEAMCMYHDEHEVANVNKDLYNIVDFEELDEEPTVVDWWYKKDKQTGEEIAIPKFRIDTICGTVLGRNKTKHTVSLLTESGVVNVKVIGAGKFSFYDRQISVPNDKGGKKIVEKSWFTRGNILLVHGIRKGDVFTPKVYKGTSYAHSIELVERIYEDGYMSIQEGRGNYE